MRFCTEKTGWIILLRRFGCVVYIHTDDGKLNPRAKKGIFVGYPTGVQGYKIWLLVEKRCVVSRNVVFQEDVLFKTLSKKNDREVEIAESSRMVELEIIPAESSTEICVDQDSSEKDSETGGVSDENETDESPVLQDYLLARDRVRRAYECL